MDHLAGNLYDNEAGSMLNILDEASRRHLSGIGGLVAVTPKYGNGIFFVDDNHEEKRAMMVDAYGQKDHWIPAAEYNGEFERPQVLILRSLGPDEMHLL